MKLLYGNSLPSNVLHPKIPLSLVQIKSLCLFCRSRTKIISPLFFFEHTPGLLPFSSLIFCIDKDILYQSRHDNHKKPVIKTTHACTIIKRILSEYNKLLCQYSQLPLQRYLYYIKILSILKSWGVHKP